MRNPSARKLPPNATQLLKNTRCKNKPKHFKPASTTKYCNVHDYAQYFSEKRMSGLDMTSPVRQAVDAASRLDWLQLAQCVAPGKQRTRQTLLTQSRAAASTAADDTELLTDSTKYDVIAIFRSYHRVVSFDWIIAIYLYYLWIYYAISRLNLLN